MHPMHLCLRMFLLMVMVSPLVARAQPLQVFILAGQSNMQGHAHVRTFEHLGMDPGSASLLAEMQNPDGTPKVLERVWISSLGSADQVQSGRLTTGYGASQNGPKIGPEYTFGIFLEKYTRAPILLIKTAWGGKSLHTDFRPPSAGPYVFHAQQLASWQQQGKDIAAMQREKEMATGVSFRLMIEHVKSVLADLPQVVPNYDAGQGYELAGFVWFQGWNDMVDSATYPNRDKPGGYDAYSEVLTHFIRDVRNELKTPQLPFVIGVLGVGGPTSEYGPEQQRYKATHDHFRAAMAAPALLPEFQGNVLAIRTEKYWDLELSAAKSKEQAILQKVKQQTAAEKLTPDREQELREKLLGEGLNERERLIVEKGISNFEFHYLGSAKILGGIGKGLAEAMAELKHLTKP